MSLFPAISVICLLLYVFKILRLYNNNNNNNNNIIIIIIIIIIIQDLIPNIFILFFFP